jgi:predicted nucleotidyltransferase
MDGELLIPDEMIARAVTTLLDHSPPGSQVILFGSYARGDASADSDLDFLVIEPTLRDRRAEMVRLRSVLRPLGVPADVLVISRPAFEAWKTAPNTVINEAFMEGKVYEHATCSRSGIPRQGAGRPISGGKNKR